MIPKKLITVYSSQSTSRSDPLRLRAREFWVAATDRETADAYAAVQGWSKCVRVVGRVRVDRLGSYQHKVDVELP